MAATKGNKFWLLRSKHGRDKIFATSEIMWEAACEYFQWCDDNPWETMEQSRASGKVGIKIEVKDTKVDKIHPTEADGLIAIPTSRPYTLHGLCIYLDVNTMYFNQFEKELKDDEISKGFSLVITRIREIIYKQKFEGAAVGAFNANIIARDLGLKDRKDLTTDDERIYGNMSEEDKDDLVNRIKDADK